jgi:SAM-dependent methyltransferase
VLPLRGRTVLEYGCGNGAVTAGLASHAGRYVGIDIDEAAVDDARRLLAEGGLTPELLVAPPNRILKETAAFKSEIDVFLCYAVLEHMTVDERLALLQLAREVVRPDGIIVVIETPNRLTPWDYHTSQLPFLNQLPEDLALRYAHRSPREEFVTALRDAAGQGPDSEREAFTRWGRGMSFHELELVFDELSHHVLASSWDPVLLPEREVYRDELALQRILDRTRPDLPAAFSRYWLDFILAPEPRTGDRRFLRPWALHTSGSTGAAYEPAELVTLTGPESVLAVALPVPSSRLVIGLDTADDDRKVMLRVPDSGREAHFAARRVGGHGAVADARLDAPGQHFEVRLDRPGVVSYVLYEG